VTDIVNANADADSGATMSSKPEPVSSRAMSQEAFRAFLLWLSEDEEKAASEYLEIRSTLVKFFVRKGCVHSEELADRTLDRVVVIAQADSSKYPKPIALCCGVARRVWLEYLREAVPEPLEADNISASEQKNADFTEGELRCLESCLEKLPADERELITRYHQFQGSQKIETRKHLAEVHGGLNRLRITTYRIRTRLHECVSGCVQHSSAY
jgi:hypothetical protein